MAATTQLNPTIHASRDKYYVPDDETCSCGHEHPHLVGRNGSKGQRTTDYVCGDCLQEWKDAPDGLFDPVLIAENPDHE